MGHVAPNPSREVARSPDLSREMQGNLLFFFQAQAITRSHWFLELKMLEEGEEWRKKVNLYDEVHGSFTCTFPSLLSLNRYSLIVIWLFLVMIVLVLKIPNFILRIYNCYFDMLFHLSYRSFFFSFFFCLVLFNSQPAMDPTETSASCQKPLSDPKTLPCLHSLCTHCIEELVKKENDSKENNGAKVTQSATSDDPNADLCCPQCSTAFVIPLEVWLRCLLIHLC